MPRPPFHLSLDQVGYALPRGRSLFDGVTLAFADERTGIVGANGSGKSTLARIIAGELAPTTGSVTRHGFALRSPASSPSGRVESSS